MIKSHSDKRKLYKSKRKAHLICLRLHALYGSPKHGNKEDPVDELVFIILSQMTTHHSFNRVYDRLKQAVGTWDKLLSISLSKTKELIKDAGLSNQKGPRIRAILKRIKKDFGKISLDSLKLLSDNEAESYLTSLPGVGVKTAKCILMYSLGRQVLPVDTNVGRVARRVGLLPLDSATLKIQTDVERVVAPEDRYSFHVNALAHGRALCLAIRPKCFLCPIKRVCVFFKFQQGSHKRT